MDILFRIENSPNSEDHYDEINPVSINEIHEILMKVEWNDYQTQEPTQSQDEIRRTQFLNLTNEEESHFANFLNQVLGYVAQTELFPDGKQYLYAQYLPSNSNFYTTPYLKIYEPFNTVFPSWVVKRLTTLFESTKV